MNHGNSRLAHGTSGSPQLAIDNGDMAAKAKENERKLAEGTRKEPIIKNGHVTLKSISDRREFFLGKSIKKIDAYLHQQGYETVIRPSKHATSRAKVIVTTNPTVHRNIAQVQVSPGSKRHGDVPYVKISTKDIGIIKIIDGTREQYKSDGNEKAKLLFRRYGIK